MAAASSSSTSLGYDAATLRPSADATKLPEPGPKLHSGMFRHKTMAEVLRARDALRTLGPVTNAASLEGDAAVAVAAAAGNDMDLANQALIAVLERLDICVVDREVLAETQIGKEVKGLQRHSLPEVAERARALVAQWKRDHATRETVVEGFQKRGGLNKRDARELERSLFEFATPLGLLEGDGYASYQRHYKRLCQHLRTGNLGRKVEEGRVTLAEAAALPDNELMSTEQLQQREEAKEEGLRAALGGLSQPDGMITQEYECPKCKSSKTQYKEVQTGWHNDQQDMTIIVLCLSCGERWKEGDDHGLGA